MALMIARIAPIMHKVRLEGGNGAFGAINTSKGGNGAFGAITAWIPYFKPNTAEAVMALLPSLKLKLHQRGVNAIFTLYFVLYKNQSNKFAKYINSFIYL